ncbi:hypothetical protein BJ322DRAFT_996754 [Thelephora terrestris]|uniref:Uncharacterized protein n=1 Tax=Thelephora terrestris TaxID=56493 RepID=A0A9P6HPC3_9AGAM|nr:hypothetical protein BJ322DRAFT_996754 [Thelephora terrestris]
MGSGDGKATQQEEARHRQRSKEPAGKPDSQTNGFTARPVDQLHDQAPSSPWRDLDMSVVISILTPLLSWAFGREYMKNILVAIFLIYYLHQLIEVPWQLYLSSRRRRPASGIPAPQVSDKHIAELASAELWRHEMLYLCLTALAPFLGVFLLRTVILTITGEDAAPWFSTTVFVLASSLRPWSHIVSRLRHRVRDLHEVIHYPSPESQLIADSRIRAILDHVDELERELDRVKRTMVLGHAVKEAHDEIFDALEDVERSVKKQDKKVEVNKTLTETRLADVESIIIRLETEGRTLDQPGFVLMRLLADLFWLPRRLWDVLPFTHLPKLTAATEKGKGSTVTPNYHTYSPPSRRPPRLETIPENGDPSAVFIPSNNGNLPRTSLRRRRPTRYPESPKEPDSPLTLFSQTVLLPYHLSLRLLTALFPPIKAAIS